MAALFKIGIGSVVVTFSIDSSRACFFLSRKLIKGAVIVSIAFFVFSVAIFVADEENRLSVVDTIVEESGVAGK